MNDALGCEKRGLSPFFCAFTVLTENRVWPLFCEKRAWPFFSLFSQLLLLAALLLPQTEAHAAPPAYRASGTFTSGTGNITVPYPASMLANDVCLLTVESENQPITLATANGFVEVPWSPQFAGTAAVNPASRLALFWKRTVGGDAAPVVTNPGNHATGRIHCFSGVITSGDPWDAGAGGNDGAVNDTTGTIPGATTASADTLVVLITSNSRNGNSTANCSAWTNASLTSLTEWSDNTNTAGLGGGHCMATGIMATAGAYATTTVTLATTSFKGAISLALKPVPTTTLATGTDPLAATIAPGAAAADVNQFTLQTSSGMEAVTSVTVNLSTNSGVGRLAITDNLGAELGFTATPAAGANTITVAGMTATTALTTFKVRVTPLSHAAMPVPPGAAYAITAPVTAWAGPNTHAGSDTNPNALTIDNLSPAGATATSGTAGADSVTLGWTTSASADFNTTSGSVLYRWTTTAGAEVPAEGSAPTVNSSNGAATVACVLSSAASAPLSGIIDGTGGSAGCNTTALAPGTDYIYKIFQKDSNGNYDTGVTIGTFTTTYPVPTTTSISPTSKTLGAATFTLTVNGTNFTPGSIVRFNGLDRTTTYVSPTQLTASIPASDLTTVGTFPITVFNPAPGGGLSNAQTFTVNPGLPTATTDAATGVTSAVATLNGTVGSNGASTTVTFEYGLTAAYGETITATQSPLAAGSPPYPTAPVSAQVIGLNCNTVFHYRVVATNSAGTTNGLDGTFTTGACSAPFPATACAATRFNGDLGCTANDVSLTNITLAPSSIASCVSGSPVTLDLDLTVNFASPDRWDVGIFIANDGKLPTLLPANGGASSCSVDVLPITPPPYGYTFPDLDGVPQGTLDTCGDGNSSINGGTGSGVKRMTGVTLPCYASPSSGGQLFVPFAVSWDNQKSPVGNLCTSNLYPVPNTTSKCNAPASSVSIAVVVLPVITKTNGGTEINPGANTVYTVVINNNSGGTLQNVVFKDPAVTDLAVNSVSCAAAGGATCPAMTSAAMITAMQGAGITIPSADLPNNGSLTFTISATLSGGATVGNHLINTASVTVGGHTSTVSDDDLIVNAPSATKSFAPGTITEGSTSLLTVTLTNPTAFAVTGVSFTDTYPAGMLNTAAAGGATTCGGTVTAANDGNSLALSGGTIPATGSCTVTVNVTSATAGSYFNSTGTVTHASGTISAASATLTVNVAVYGGFNACDSAAAPNATCTNTTTATDSRITTKIAGSAFNLDIVALKTDGTRNTNYSNNVIVELLDASSGGALDAYNCSSGGTWPVIATLAPNPAFTNPDNGLITVGPFTVPEAYRDVRVRVTNSGGTTKKGCSTDNFAIRPNSLTVNPTDTDWQTAGTARALVNTGVTGGIVHKAGQPFTVTATAKNASNVTTANYAGTPALTVTDCSPAGTACTASLGTFALGVPSTFAAGVLTSNLATYSEAGAFGLTLQDTNFASVDAADTAASCAGYYVCGTASVGRFVPDHFDTAVVATAITPMPCPDGLTCPLLYDGFVYSGQAFSVQVTARNAAGATTVNYDSTKALSKDVTLSAWDTVGGATANPGGGTLTFNTVLSTAFSAGVATTSTPVYTFPTTPVAPTDIYLRALDAESVTSLRAASVEGGVKIVSGRVKIGNAHGSELLDLPMTATVQYYNGTNWLTSTTDDVTSFNTNLSTGGGNIVATIVIGLASGVSVSGAGVVTVTGGVKTFTLNKPLVTGSADISLNAPSYLPSVRGRATFGVYKGNNEFIYLRETY